MNKPEKMPEGYFGWSTIDGEHGITLLKDALHNLSKRENCDQHEFAKGVLVGVVSALMATGLNFEDACQLAWQCCPQDIDPRRVPSAWRDQFCEKPS